MALIFWWLLLVWPLAGGAYWLARWWWLRRRRPAASPAVPIAHSDRLLALPEYQLALQRYRRLLRWSWLLLTLLLAAAIVESARPATVTVVVPAQQSRDIMLCLDSSGSVLREDTRLLNRFSSLVNDFSGQRFGLTLFNSSALAVIPLNDNYQLTISQLQTASRAFSAQKGATFTRLTDGTLAGFEQGTSLVSDGLTSCLNRLGDNLQHRSQSVILATDNEVNGKPIVSLDQAAGLAKKHNIRIYAIDPGLSDPTRQAQHQQLRAAAESTGGQYFQLSNNGSVGDIVSAISRQESAYFGGTPQLATNDNPKPLLYGLAVVSLLALALLWRLES